MNRLLLLLLASFVIMRLADGAESSLSSSSTSSSSSRTVKSSLRLLPSKRSLAHNSDHDEMYNTIMALKNETIPSKCYVAVSHYVVVWCDINVPVGLYVKAEIKDGTCDDFVEVASGSFFRKGIASPIFLPEISHEEMRNQREQRGVFEKAYCARMDVFYNPDGDDTDEKMVSVLDRRFPMGVAYNYVDRGNGKSSGDGEFVKEELSSAILTDGNSKVEKQNLELVVGLSALSGALVTLSLIAIIYGQRKKSTRKQWQEIQRKEVDVVEADMVQGGGSNCDNVEIPSITSPLNEDNDII